MPIEVYSVVDGQRVDMPSGDAAPAASGQADGSGAGQTAAPGATDQPPAGDGQPPASPPGPTPLPGEGESPGDTDEDDTPLQDDSEITAARLERRFARLTRLRRQAERDRDTLAHQHQVEVAQLRGQNEAIQRMLAGAAPALPEPPAQPSGPPQSDQYAIHEDYVLAAARYGAQQELAARDQMVTEQQRQDQQRAFQQQLMQREQDFKTQHPDFDTVVRTGLAGIGGTVLQQALMLVPDGPAVAYTLASKPELVQRLLTLPPPLVLVELGRLSPPATPTPANGTTTNGAVTPPPALPAPMTPLSGAGAGAPTGSYREDMSAAEYAAWRKRTSRLEVWKNR